MEKLIKECKRYRNNALTDKAVYVLKMIQATEEEVAADLLVAPLKMLGFKEPASIYEVNKRIIELGFYLLSDELVFNLFLQIKNTNEFLNLAMRPIVFPDGQKIHFAIKKSIMSCRSESKLPIEYYVVFVQRIFTVFTNGDPLENLKAQSSNY